MRLALGFGLLMAAATAPALATPGCVPNSNLVSAERATQFLDNPSALLNQFKEGQGGLASEIRDLLTVRPETIEGINSLAKASSADQSRAIGAGLGTAASVCVLTQPAVAQQIQEVVLKTENPALIQSFVSITGDIPTEATNGADPTGEATAGGGRDTTAPGAGATGTTATTDTPFLTQVSSASAPTTTTSVATVSLFTAATVAATPVLTTVSPSR